jgi:8-oxo-dGTP pyrophosphatase MutT (NUDIX family)
MESERRKTAMFIPYTFRDGEYFVYMQKRSINAKRNSGSLGFWGGGLENNENFIEAFKRELFEELNYSPKNFIDLGIFEDDYSISQYYAEKVDDDFDKNILIKEGDGGIWINAKEIFDSEKVSQNTKGVVRKLLVTTTH